MKHPGLYHLLCLVLLCLVAGCDIEAATRDKETAEPRPTSPTATVTVLNQKGKCRSQEEMPRGPAAPSYQDIQLTLQRIVGDDLSLNEQERDAFDTYLDSLVDKQVDGWTGYVRAVMPDREHLAKFPDLNLSDVCFTVTIRMPDADLNSEMRNFNDVILHDVPYEQIANLDAWLAPFGVSDDDSQQEVAFNGNILYVTRSNTIVIIKAQVIGHR